MMMTKNRKMCRYFRENRKLAPIRTDPVSGKGKRTTYHWFELQLDNVET